MEVLVLDGKNFVKASKAASDLGYANDYVGQLCRSGQVEAHLIGRTWYVNQEQLGSHRVEKKRMSRVKAREHAKKSIEEHRLKVNEAGNTSKNIDIQYENDEKELIPQTKKLTVTSLSVQNPNESYSDSGEESEMEIQNEGDKVVMSGDITVVDVTDGPVDSDIITLTPSRIKKSSIASVTPQKRLKIEEKAQADTAEETEEPVEPERTTHFLDRLEKKDALVPVEAIPTVPNEPTEPEMGPQSIIPYLLVVLVLAVVVIATFPVSIVATYSHEEKGKLQINVKYTPKETFETLRSKI